MIKTDPRIQRSRPTSFLAIGGCLCLSLLAMGPSAQARVASWGINSSSIPQSTKNEQAPDISQEFSVPKELKSNIEFWHAIYSRYHGRHVLLHDKANLNIIYLVLDLSNVFTSANNDAEAHQSAVRIIDGERNRLSQLLRNLARRLENKSNPLENLTPEEQRILRAFKELPFGPQKLRDASKRIRAQRGMRDEFLRGIWDISPYLPYLEQNFKETGLSPELALLTFVESMFQLDARSHVGAAGPYQFMRATGKSFLRINRTLDERYDPIHSSRAAAQLLKRNYTELGTWPLAITAYNHGVTGIKRAIRQTGTKDLATIIKYYRSRSFRFASRNFYAEFLAAQRVYRDRHILFADHPEFLTPRPPWRWDEVTLPDYVSLSTLLEHTHLTKDELRRFNPALTRNVFNGKKWLPKNYPLRVPRDHGQKFAQEYKSIPLTKRFTSQKKRQAYVVRRGDTLGRIASRTGTPVASLIRWNALPNANELEIGQQIRLTPTSRLAQSHDRSPSPTLRIVDAPQLPEMQDELLNQPTQKKNSAAGPQTHRKETDRSEGLFFIESDQFWNRLPPPHPIGLQGSRPRSGEVHTWVPQPL